MYNSVQSDAKSVNRICADAIGHPSKIFKYDSKLVVSGRVLYNTRKNNCNLYGYYVAFKSVHFVWSVMDPVTYTFVILNE